LMVLIGGGRNLELEVKMLGVSFIWNVLTEDERSERRKTCHSTVRTVALKAKAKCCTRRHSGEEGKGLVT